jgi:WhiB family transcriptional regulator, redox-sensing transcriptional regulator
MAGPADNTAFELRPQPWMGDANCIGVDPDVFFPQRGDPTNEAKTICRACSVRAECLDYALSINERHGIWGGTSERQRRTIRQQTTLAQRRQRRDVINANDRLDGAA